MVEIEVDNKTYYIFKDLDIIVKSNYIESVEILDLNDYYLSDIFKETNPNDTFNLLGKKIAYNFAVGPQKIITIDENIINNIQINGNTQNFGTQTIKLYYNNDIIIFDIQIVCNHKNNFTNPESGYKYKEELSLNPTCEKVGYDLYKCDICNDIKYYYISKTEHTLDYSNVIGAVIPTCTTEGYSGNICCTLCDKIMIYGTTIQKSNHSYEFLDDNKHICNKCNKDEYHQYVITEDIKQITDAYGNTTWNVIYEKTCICKYKNDDSVKFEEIDENELTELTNNQPSIIINDGYVLNNGDEVSVYVQLINNYTGFKTINFGIRYPDGLELINKPENGTLISGTMVSEDNEVDHGYNFLWANDKAVFGDGNLVKLSFKVVNTDPSIKKFDISVVISDIGKTKDNKIIEGGLTNNGKINVVTKSGSIYIVDKLPGDVNENGIVDLYDAVYLGKFFVNPDKYSLTAKEADINLDGYIRPDDISDLLEYLVGGYGTNLRTQSFEIKLESSLIDYEINALLGSIYDFENNTYEKAGLTELELNGYKFNGWSYKRYTNNPDDLINLSDNIIYNKNQKIQTLYAQWELNNIIFKIDDITEDKIYFNNSYNSVYFPQNEDKIYNISFISEIDKNDNIDDTLTYSFLYWEDPITNHKYTNENDFINLLNSINLGQVTLNAIYNDVPIISYPNWKYEGYTDDISWYADNNDFNIKLTDPNDILEYCSTTTKNSKTYYKVYSKHSLIKFRISIDYNGGTKGIENAEIYKEYTMKDTINIWSKVNNFYKTGYDHISWDVYINNELYKSYLKSAQTELSNIIIKENNSSEIPTIIIKAEWKPISYTVYYNVNTPTNASNTITNTPNSQDTWEYDSEEIYLPEEPILKGWNFTGWYKDKESIYYVGGSKEKLNKPNLSTKESVTLYAGWEPKKINIYINLNCFPFVDTLYKTVEYDSVIGTLPTPTKENYVFLGWSMDLLGENYIYEYNKVSSTSNIYLYANWLCVKDTWSVYKPDGNRDKLITDGTANDPTYTEIINFNNININYLKENNYKKIKLTIEIGMLEEDDGYQELYFYKYNTNDTYTRLTCRNNISTSSPCYNCVDTNNDSKMGNDLFVFETYDEDKVDDWHTHTFVFEFNIDDLFSSYNKFKIGYGANGKNDDDWRLGHTIISVEFYK